MEYQIWSLGANRKTMCVPRVCSSVQSCAREREERKTQRCTTSTQGTSAHRQLLPSWTLLPFSAFFHSRFCHFLIILLLFSLSFCCLRHIRIVASPSLPSFSWMMHHPCLLSGEIFHFLTFSIRSSISQTFYRGKLLTRRAGINLKTNIFRMEAE